MVKDVTYIDLILYRRVRVRTDQADADYKNLEEDIAAAGKGLEGRTERVVTHMFLF